MKHYIFTPFSLRALFAGFLFLPFFLSGQEILIIPVKEIEAQFKEVVEWRHHFHQNPELSNREFETGKRIAKELKAMGLEVETGVAHTGVVAVLRGGLPGKVVALRADIDALPVTERSDLPYKSNVKTMYGGQEVGVMHACGHDTHTAILLGTAKLLSRHREKIQGTIKFIFQPAEEGPPEGEEGGALLMVKEGVLKNPDVDAIFGLHIKSTIPVGKIGYKSGGVMAAAQTFTIRVMGKQSHGAYPWNGVDPILISAKIIDGLQTLVSREAQLTQEAAVVSVGRIQSGQRFNIIPESAEMQGTIRTLDYDMKEEINRRMREMVPAIAKSYGGEAKVQIRDMTDITYNHPELVEQMLPSLKKAAGEGNVFFRKAVTGAEDFSYFSREVPGFYFFLGGMNPENSDPFEHHTPDFTVEDEGMLLGLKAMTQLALDYLNR